MKKFLVTPQLVLGSCGCIFLSLVCSGCSHALNVSKKDKSASLKARPLSIPDDSHFTKNRFIEFGTFNTRYGFMLWQSLHPDFNDHSPSGTSQSENDHY